MSELAEDAVRLAILTHPQSFGLSPEEVNPMLLYSRQRMETGEDPESTPDAWRRCFDAVNQTLQLKVAEVFGNRTSAAPKAAAAKSTAKSAAKSSGKRGNEAEVVEKATVGQIKYLGYLHYQLGQTPDYKAINALSKGAATRRIAELEAQRKVKDEASA